MQIIMFICVCIIAVFFSIQLLSLVSIFKSNHVKPGDLKEYPKVSILLAARNEALLIERCLTAIEALKYPEDKLEVIIGEDASTDDTAAIVSRFIEGKSNYKLVSITEQLGKARGKANVLAHLAHEANGAYYFITDVDVKLPPGWIESLLSQFQDDVGIVSGTSTCEPTNSFFSVLQSIDWLHFMGYIQSFANIDVACTSVGNNMAVSSKAYWETGGYEKIDFSITEDYKLFKEVTGLGYGWRTVLNPRSLGLAWYIPSVSEMWHQRKRWLIGAQELPFLWKSLIVLYGLFVPVLIVLVFVAPFNALAIWVSKIIIQSLYIQILSNKVGLKPYGMFSLIVYEVYVIINTVCTAVFYFLPIASVWKGRIYQKSDLT